MGHYLSKLFHLPSQVVLIVAKKDLSIKILSDGPRGTSAPAARDLANAWPKRATPRRRPGARDYIVHRILQARILEWVTFLFARGSSQARDRTQVSCYRQILYQLSHKKEKLMIKDGMLPTSL